MDINKKKLIGLISSVAFENQTLIRKLRLEKKILNGPNHCYTGRSAGNDIVCLISGVGKTNAAYAAALLVEKYAPALIINFGIGGAYPSSGLKIGDIAVAEKEIYGDEGTLVKEGFSDMRMTGIPLLKKGRKKYFNEFTLDKAFLKKTVNSLGAVHPPIPPLVRGGEGGVQFKSGTFITVSACTGTIKRALELEKRYQALCENMEGAAIAHICAMHGISMIEIRGISNIVENRDTKKWDIKLASKNCQKAVLEILKLL